MSRRRYGRNQKRIHKAELAEAKDKIERLEGAIEMESGLLRYVRKNFDNLQETFLRMAKIIENISKNSIALPVKQSDQGKLLEESGTIRLPNILPPVYSHIHSQRAWGQEMALSSVDLFRIEALVEAHQESMQAAVWLRVGDECVGRYFVSRKALLSMEKVDIERILCRDIAAGFARLLQQGDSHG
jgi:hypothetical protein